MDPAIQPHQPTHEQPEPRLDSSTAILDTSRQLSTARQPRQQLSSCQARHLSTAPRQLDSDATLRCCQGCQAVNSTARQLDISTAEAGASMHELVAPLDMVCFI